MIFDNCFVIFFFFFSFNEKEKKKTQVHFAIEIENRLPILTEINPLVFRLSFSFFRHFVIVAVVDSGFSSFSLLFLFSFFEIYYCFGYLVVAVVDHWIRLYRSFVFTWSCFICVRSSHAFSVVVDNSLQWNLYACMTSIQTIKNVYDSIILNENEPTKTFDRNSQPKRVQKLASICFFFSFCLVCVYLNVLLLCT